MKLKNLFNSYFISTSILAHCLIIVVAVYFVSERVTSHWRWPIVKQWFLGDIDKTDVYPLDYNDFESLPKGQWLKIHQQRADDRVHFVRQAHAGSAYDQLRSRLMLFGSNTHGTDWNNTIYSFDLNTLQWIEAYPADLPETYTVNAAGIPVAGEKQNHPWAMHTFAAIVFDALRNKLFVASYPEHMRPEKYGQRLASKWKLIKKHPTWQYDILNRQWQALEGKSILFFPYAIAYNSDTGSITGFRPNGVFEWNEGLGWKKVARKSIDQYHTNAVYDSVNDVFILYGGNKMNNTVHTYAVGDKATKEMLTKNLRPPVGQSVPMAFHKGIAKAVALIDGDELAQTWLYDYALDQWQKVEGADFPYKIGMNYSMEYDVKHRLIVLVSSPKNQQTAVWVLKL